MALLGERPAAAVDALDVPATARALAGFKHRFNVGADVACLLGYLQQMRGRAGSVEAFFNEGDDPAADDVEPGLTSFCTRALQLARDAGPVADNGIFVVGDTPHDIECANAIGARTVAVATGGYSLDELQSHRPWRAFDELPAAEEFARLIDEARQG
jgi:hypothetical protein